MASGEVRVVAESALPALVAAAQAETPEKRVEAAAQVPFTTENLDALVRAAGAPGAGWTPQEAPWKCMQLLCQARRLQEDFSTSECATPCRPGLFFEGAHLSPFLKHTSQVRRRLLHLSSAAEGVQRRALLHCSAESLCVGA